MRTQALTLIVASSFLLGAPSFAKSSLKEVKSSGGQSKMRLSHAKELLGGGYKKSAVKKSENVKDISEFVKETTAQFLPKKFKKSSAKIAKAIMDSAEKHQFDPIFLMAVIQNESSFNPTRKGSFGEIGLMQIKPTTAEWIADRYDLDYDDAKSLYDPVKNIKIGSALMAKLRNQFDSHSRLYVSAYNIGAKKVRSMVAEKNIPKEYVQAVMRRYVAIYSAFKVEATSKVRSQIALRSVERTIAEN